MLAAVMSQGVLAAHPWMLGEAKVHIFLNENSSFQREHHSAMRLEIQKFKP